MTYHIIYKTTCRVTGRFYVGMHSTDDLDDGYFGSGHQIQRSLEVHGKESHHREVIEFCSTRTILKQRERELVNEQLLRDPRCMNLTVGGEGGPTRQGKTHTNEAKAKIRQSLMGHKISEETRNKIGAKSKGRGAGVPLTEEHKAKLRRSSEARHQAQLRRWARAKMSDSDLQFYCDDARHLVCVPYTVANLHEMARQLRVKRCWFHSSPSFPHYDIPKRRIEEITARCTLVSSRDILRVVKGTYNRESAL